MLAAELQERTARIRQGGGETARQRHTDQGKLFVHDRVTLLLDPQSPFLELSPLADWDPLLWARALPVAHMFQR